MTTTRAKRQEPGFDTLATARGLGARVARLEHALTPQRGPVTVLLWGSRTEPAACWRRDERGAWQWACEHSGAHPGGWWRAQTPTPCPWVSPWTQTMAVFGTTPEDAPHVLAELRADRDGKHWTPPAAPPRAVTLEPTWPLTSPVAGEPDEPLPPMSEPPEVPPVREWWREEEC